MEKEVVKELGNKKNNYDQTNVRVLNLDKVQRRKSEKQSTSIGSIQPAQVNALFDLDQFIIDENGFVQTLKREIRVSIDDVSGNLVVSVIEGTDKELVRVISNEEVLAEESMVKVPTKMLFRANG